MTQRLQTCKGTQSVMHPEVRRLTFPVLGHLREEVTREHALSSVKVDVRLQTNQRLRLVLSQPQRLKLLQPAAGKKHGWSICWTIPGGK